MTCPICSKPSDAKLTPFCSKRCADVDLSRWLKGSYAIPGAPAGEEDESGPAGSASGDAESDKNRGFRRTDKGMDRE